MPTYEYVCDACGHELEVFQSISEPHKRKCPKCGRSKLRRRIGTGAGIVFKGGGFYQTDYRSESYRKSEAEAKKSAEGGDAKPAPETSTAPSDKTAKKKPRAKDGETS